MFLKKIQQLLFTLDYQPKLSKSVSFIILIWMLLTVPLVVVVRASASKPTLTCQRSLLISSFSINLSDNRIVNQLLQQPVDRIILPCFVGGETIFPTHSELFHETSRYRNRGDVLQVLLKKAHTRRIKVYAFIDCLHWLTSEETAQEDIFVHHPQLVERDANGLFGSLKEGKYASPFNSHVRQVLIDLVKEVGTRYPRLDGIVLQCSLSNNSVLGYSSSARVAYIHATHIDPVDINDSDNLNAAKQTSDWTHWRVVHLGLLVQALSKTFLATNHVGEVATVGDGYWYHYSLEQRNTSLGDWINWGKTGAVSEVLLKADWVEPSHSTTYSSDVSLAATEGSSIILTMVLPLRDKNEFIDPLTALENQQGQHKKSLLLQVDNAKDLPLANKFWTEVLPKLQPNL